MESESTAKSVICIPGNWKDQSDLVTAIVKANGGEYIYAGLLMMNIRTRESFKLEVCERDERMREAFAWSGQLTGISDDTLDEIETHSIVVYISGKTGSFRRTEAIARAAGAVLKGGGIGVKVDTCGKAFDKNVWLAYLDNFKTHFLYDMFVVDSLAEDDGTVFSSGMHNIGLKDTIVSGEEFQNAVDLIRIFSFYQIVDSPTIYSQQTFTPSSKDPTYEITKESDQPYQGDDLFENPFGMWRLQRK